MNEVKGTFKLDPVHTNIGFVARHAMVTKVRGGFHDIEGTIVVDPDNADNNSVTAVIKTESVDTGNAQRDGHVRSADFFNVEEFPEMTFVGTSYDLDDSYNGTITGDLTLRGVTRPVTLDVEFYGIEEDASGDIRLGFEATTKINRQDYGVAFQSKLKTGGVMVSNEIKIEIEGSAVKQTD